MIWRRVGDQYHGYRDGVQLVTIERDGQGDCWQVSVVGNWRVGRSPTLAGAKSLALLMVEQAGKPLAPA